MVQIVLDPVADRAALPGMRARLVAALAWGALADGEAPPEVELGPEGRPRHLVLQLLASAAATAGPGRLRFGPRAAAEVARMGSRRGEGGAAGGHRGGGGEAGGRGGGGGAAGGRGGGCG